MKLSELISKIGDANIQVQFLDNCLSNIQTNKRGVSRVTFDTKAINATQIATDTDMVGIILWMDRTAFKKATDAAVS